MRLRVWLRSVVLTAAVAALVALAPAGGNSAKAQAAGAGTLTIGITQYPSTLHPQIESMLAKSYVLAMTRRPLTTYDQDWQLICMLCVELPTLENGLAEVVESDNGEKTMRVRMEIHPQATWGDGTPVTVDDVILAWEVGKHPKSGVAAGEQFRRITDIERHDDKTFTLHVDRVTFDYNEIALGVLPAHIEREIFEAAPAEYRNRTAYDTDPTNPALAFGPYRIVELATGSHIILEPNPTWYGQAPHFERIVVRVIENTAALEANLLSGSIDMISGELGLKIDQALAFEERHGDGFDIIYKPSLTYEHIDLMLDNPILADRQVRRALIYAIDRTAINERLFGGEQPVAHANVSPLDVMHAEDVPKYVYDPEKAAALLDEAGWDQMKRGVRHNAKGEPLRLSIMTTAGDRSREQVQQVLQAMWKRVGVDVRIDNEPARVLFGETISKRKFDAMTMYAWLSAPQSVPRTTLHSDSIPTAENNWSGQNYTGFSDPRVDELIDAIERELDTEDRRKLWAELQKIYARELPVLPLYWRATPFIVPKWLKGLRPTGHLASTTLWIEEWRREP